MKLINILSIIGASLFLSACSTTPVTLGSAELVPKERIYQPSYVGAASKESDATVVFIRDAGFSGSACSHDIYIGSVKVFSIHQGEKMTIHVPAGQHFFRLETGAGLCPNISTSKETTIAAGSRQVYRILLPSAGNLHLTRIE